MASESQIGSRLAKRTPEQKELQIAKKASKQADIPARKVTPTSGDIFAGWLTEIPEGRRTFDMHIDLHRLTKRSIDILISAVALAVLSPVLAIAAFLVLCLLGRPVLFRQERPGLHGKPFTLCKFRTMLNGDGTDHERLTNFGRFLRSSSLDELPELWNILRGEMSLVGPRPLLPEYLPLYDERQATRHNVKPGLTGLAQVSGRNGSTWEERLELDARYVESPSLVEDFKILCTTFGTVLRREGVSNAACATMPKFNGRQPSIDFAEHDVVGQPLAKASDLR